MCSTADAVILTVARGQQRPLVERAMSHLLVIGARLAGVVFNKAQSRDFERSISSMSLRASVGVYGEDGKALVRKPTGDRMGPVASAVASSFKSKNGNDRT